MFCRIALFFLCTALGVAILAQEPVKPKTPSSGNKSRSPGIRRVPRSKATLPPGIFGAEKTPPPAASGTTLGGTVPALWEIERSAPNMDDEHFPALLDRNTIAPAVPGKVIRYATRLIQLHDANADGVLQEEEWKTLPGAPQAMDIDGDHEITLEEMIRFLAIYGQDRTIHNPHPIPRYYQPQLISSQFQLFKPISPPLAEPMTSAPQKTSETSEQSASGEEPAEKEGDLTEEEMEDEETPVDDATYEEIAANRPVSAVKKYHTAPETLRGLPAWFLFRDRDGDGQVSLKEFAPLLSTQSLALFGRFDKNGDGFITPDEARTPPTNENHTGTK